MEPSTQRQLTLRKVNKAYRSAKGPSLDLLAQLANLPDGYDIPEIPQRTAPVIYWGDGRPESDDPFVLTKFCRGLRTVWKALADPDTNQAPAGKILREWYEEHPLNDRKFWIVSWIDGVFFPTENNWKFFYARVLLDNKKFLGICKECHRYFRKRRIDSSYCLSEPCERKKHLERQQKYLKTHPRKKAV